MARNTKTGSIRRIVGFTLVELVMVIAIIMILMSVAAPRYTQAIKLSKEAALKQNLVELRKAINSYTWDKRQSPQSLEELVEAKYLYAIPKDPIVGTQEWDVLIAEAEEDGFASGIVSVRSASTEIATDGTRYNEW